jgi:hypothetical protein
MPAFIVPETPWHRLAEQRMVLRRVWNGDYSLAVPVLSIDWGWQGEADGQTYENPGCWTEPVRRVQDAEFDVRLQLEVVRHQVECLDASDDVGIPLANVPAFDMIVFGTGPLSTAFGSRFILREGAQPFFEPVLHTPEEALAAKKPDLLNDGICPRILERLRYYNEATQGKVILTPCDTAGPWSIATQIWHYEDMLAATRTAPEAVHSFLDLVTDTVLEWYNLQEAYIGRWGRTHTSFSSPWSPRGLGIGDDCMVCVSPATFEEFFLPYNNRLSREYGGLAYHCCLRYESHFPSLVKTENFLGFDAQPGPNDFDKIEAALSEAHGIWTRICGPGDMDYIRRLRGKVGMFFSVHGENRGDAVAKAREFLAELHALE